MNSHSLVPPFRVEIRERPTRGAEDSVLWNVFDTAATATQGEDKIKRARFPQEIQARVAENVPIDFAPAPVVADSAEASKLIEQLGAENLAQRREIISLKQKISEHADAQPAAAAPEEIAALPFALGDELRDVHTGAVVRVAEINPLHMTGEGMKPRVGFVWVNDAVAETDPTHTGFCPLASAGCFVKADATEEKPAETAPGETPTEPTQKKTSRRK